MNFDIEIIHFYSPHGRIGGYKLHFIGSKVKVLSYYWSRNKYIEIYYDSGDNVMDGSDTRAKFYHEHVKFYTV